LSNEALTKNKSNVKKLKKQKIIALRGREKTKNDIQR